MDGKEREQIVWEGAKALIAGAVKYDLTKSLPPLYVAIMENSSWENTVDVASNILKKYGGKGTTMEVLARAAEDFMKNGVKSDTS